MARKILLEIIGLIMIVGLFSIVLVKYYDEDQKSSLGKMLHTGAVVSGYKVQDQVDKERIVTSFAEIKQTADQNRFSQGLTNSVPVLVYHGISPQENGNDVTIRQFEDHMLSLKKAGYQTVTLDDLYAFMRGEKQLPQKSFVLTFDDGRKDSYYFTDYTLKVLNFTAVMFIVTKYSIESDHPYYLNLEELNKMKQSGRWDIQSHSYEGHARIEISPEGDRGSFFGNKMWIEPENRVETDHEYRLRIYNDIAKAKENLETEFDHEIHSFAIPFSDFGQFENNFPGADKINAEIYQEFHKMFFYQYKPIKNRDFRTNYNDRKKDTYFVMRITVYPSTTAEDLLAEMDASQEITLPYQEDFGNGFRWLGTWGNFTFGEDSLLLTNTAQLGTTLAYLDGSYLLRDYSVKVGIDDIQNSSFSLVTRFQNVDTYSHCIYNEKYVVFESIVEGQQIDFTRVKIPPYLSLHSAKHIGANVLGQNVECLIDDTIIFKGEAAGVAPYGGVALKSWLPKNNSQGFVKFNSFEITEVKP